MCDENIAKNNKGDDDMTTNTISRNYTLNETDALKIINAPIKKIASTNAKHDFKLSKQQRIREARKLFD
jgi:hypothetical protein